MKLKITWLTLGALLVFASASCTRIETVTVNPRIPTTTDVGVRGSLYQFVITFTSPSTTYVETRNSFDYSLNGTIYSRVGDTFQISMMSVDFYDPRQPFLAKTDGDILIQLPEKVMNSSYTFAYIFTFQAAKAGVCNIFFFYQLKYAGDEYPYGSYKVIVSE